MFRLRERELQKLLTPGKKAQRKKRKTTKQYNLSHILFNTNKNCTKKDLKKEQKITTHCSFCCAVLFGTVFCSCRVAAPAALESRLVWPSGPVARNLAGPRQRQQQPLHHLHLFFIYTALLLLLLLLLPHCCHQQRWPHGVSVLFEGFYAPYKSFSAHFMPKRKCENSQPPFQPADVSLVRIASLL